MGWQMPSCRSHVLHKRLHLFRCDFAVIVCVDRAEVAFVDCGQLFERNCAVPISIDDDDDIMLRLIMPGIISDPPAAGLASD